MRPATGAAAYSRHAQQAAAFGDVLAGEDFDREETAAQTYATSSSATATAATNASVSAAPLPYRPASATGAAPAGRTIARGAPLFSAPRIDNAWGEPAAGGGSSSSAFGKSSVGSESRPPSGASKAAGAAGGASGGAGAAGGASAMLAEALREKERRAMAADAGVASVYDPTAELAAEREKDAARSTYATPYDPGAAADREGRSSREASRDMSASERTVSGTSPTPEQAAGGGKAGGSSASSSEPMPVAPLMPTMAQGAGAGGQAMLLPDPRLTEVSAAALDFSDVRRFLTTPVPRSAGVVQCSIDRDKSSIHNRLYPMYTLSFNNRFLLAGKKRTYNKTSNYLITMDKRDLNRESPAYLGKLRSNMVGTEYVVFDDGESLEGKAPGSAAAAASASAELRQELGVVCYASNVLGTRGPRKMKVAVPKVLPEGKRVLFQPDREEDSMLAKFKAGYIQDMFLMINKPPKWNDQVGAYVLNFNGRVTMASVKNFQLVSPDDHETVVLQFGRTGKDTFSMDLQWPLSPLQAFTICLSSFDYKLACE